MTTEEVIRQHQLDQKRRHEERRKAALRALRVAAGRSEDGHR